MEKSIRSLLNVGIRDRAFYVIGTNDIWVGGHARFPDALVKDSSRHMAQSFVITAGTSILITGDVTDRK